MSSLRRKLRLSRGWLRLISATGVLAVVLVVPLLLTSSESATEASPEPSCVLTFDSDGHRYNYNAVTDTESLFDLGVDPRCLNNLALKRPKIAAHLRLHLLCELGVSNFEEIRQQFSPAIERLRGLGYL